MQSLTTQYGGQSDSKVIFEMPSTKGFGPIVDDIDVLFYSINTAHKWIRNIFKHRLIFQYLILWLPVRKYGQSEVPSSVWNRCHNSLLNYLLWTEPWHKPRQMKPLGWSTCHLRFFSWLLDHVIYLKLRKKNLLLQEEQLTKWQLFSSKMTTSFTHDHFEWFLWIR